MKSLMARSNTGTALIALFFFSAACGQDSPTSATPTAAPAPPPPVGTPDAARVPAEVGAWLDANVHPFEGSHLSLPHDDLEFLRDLVGDARIVALGENTHGTRDFFEMKARMLRFFAEEMDFDTFAIEASWPEARRLDRYVRTGEGESAELLSGLYIWPWRTESVLEMIEWMRDHNEAGGDLGFHGVDMQFPGMPLHQVREFIRSVDPVSLAAVSEDLDCLARFANGPDGYEPSPSYREQPATYLAECGASLEEVRQHLEANRERYEVAAGAEAFEIARQSLRVAVQYHLSDTREQSRDESMAENTIRLSERIGPEGRMVLWAHNFHILTRPGAQGYYQRRAFGDDMVVIGFTHANGRLTARLQEAGRSGCGDLGEFDLDPPVAESYEAYFAEASAPRFVLDLRRLSREPGNTWLFDDRLFRHSGACYTEEDPERYWDRTPLSDWFDAIIHFDSTRATTLLPRRPPSTF